MNENRLRAEAFMLAFIALSPGCIDWDDVRAAKQGIAAFRLNAVDVNE